MTQTAHLDLAADGYFGGTTERTEIMSEPWKRLSINECKQIISKGLYWDEVASRHGAREILEQEFGDLFRQHGLILLWVVLDYAHNAIAQATGTE